MFVCHCSILTAVLSCGRQVDLNLLNRGVHLTPPLPPAYGPDICEPLVKQLLAEEASPTSALTLHSLAATISDWHITFSL